MTPVFRGTKWIAGAAFLSLAGCAGFQQHAVTGYEHVSVYYAATQEFDPSAPTGRAFTNKGTRKEHINFGEADVRLALPHSVGVQRDFAVAKIETPKKDGQGDFHARTNAETGTPAKPLVVFVHGFNTDFESTAERAAMFSRDLQPNVSTKAAIFSWPSKQSLFGYAHDEDVVLVNQDRARQVLRDLRRHDVSNVVLIGHSMGCRVLTMALREIELVRDQDGTPKQGHPYFAHLVLIEPDVDKEYFRINIPRVRAVCADVTVYASNHDKALHFSNLLHDDEREGELGAQGLSKKIDVIDASAAKTDWIGHSYDGPQLFDDMRALLRGETRDQRLGKTLVKHPPGVYALKK